MTDWTHDLDRLDLRILKALQGEGRISNLKLAGSVALSPSAVLAGCGAFCGTATFWATVQMYPEIMECHRVAGGFAYLLKTRMGGMAVFRASAGNALATARSTRDANLCNGGKSRRYHAVNVRGLNHLLSLASCIKASCAAR